VDGPDGGPGGLDHPPAGGEADLAGGMGGLQRIADGLDEPGQLVAAAVAQFAERRSSSAGSGVPTEPGR